MVAPEIVLVLLGPAWAGVVVPFRILALGMLFRTSYKLSDSVARATGAVYARAWRQAVFAGAVVAGSLIGQLWGVDGVALGVVAAIALNFALMAQLSLRLTGLRWADFGAAHLPAFALSAALGVGTWLLLGWSRGLQVAPLVLLLEVALFAAAGGLLLCWCIPALFLGQDARSLLRTLATLVPGQLQRRPLVS
jgi:PST family polysaccharide transporter